MFKIKEIPEERNEGGNHIGMGTLNRREGLHLWIGHHEKIESAEGKETIFVKQSVRLTRKDAQNLVDEINERLFQLI